MKLTADDHSYGSHVCGEWSLYKNGKLKYWMQHQFTWLRTCDFCGFLSTPQKVSYRSYEYATLCMACWNRYRAVDKDRKQCNAASELLKKLKRAIYERTKENAGIA